MNVLELAGMLGTLVFAASGAMLGVRKSFDLLGVIVLGCVTAVGGGSLRDVLMGATPPIWFRDERYFWVAIIGSLVGFLAYHKLEKREQELDVLDALGLALFAATGAQQGISLGFGLLGVIFIGTVSGVGGGVIRDVLAQESPRIFLPGELYASTAAAGCLVMYLLQNSVSNEINLGVGVLITFGFRMISRQYRLSLPVRAPKKP